MDRSLKPAAGLSVIKGRRRHPPIPRLKLSKVSFPVSVACAIKQACWAAASMEEDGARARHNSVLVY